MKIHSIWLLLGVLWLSACTSPDSPSPESNEYLVETTLVSDVDAATLRSSLNQALGPQGAAFTLLVRSGVKQLRLTYKTKDMEGKEVIASGALVIPTGFSGVALPLASIQHGTLFDESDAPSYFKPGTEITFGTLFAGAGFIIAMPDYLGYGASKNVPHPYEHRVGSADPNVDFLLAVEEYLSQEKINWNNRLMLGGYSQGGYVTLAMQKKLEETSNSPFRLVASSCGAGAYNKSLTVRRLVSEPSAGDISHNRSYIWVLQTYDRLYRLNRPLSAYFRSPFAEQIAQNGLRVELTGSFLTFLQPTLIQGILSGSDTALLNAISDNDLLNWAPKTPTRLYHGTADTYVPYYNSETTAEEMRRRGATQVQLIPISGGDHASSITTFLLGTYEMFSTYAN